MTVYGDLLFLINFSMDFLCFYLSCLLLRERIKVFRVCLSSALGGVYSVMALFVEVDGIFAFLIDISVLLLMCFVAYFEKGITFWSLIKRVGLYFIVSSLLGGFMTAVFSLVNRLEILGEDVALEEGLDVWIFAALALISSMLTLKGGAIFRTSGVKKEALIEISEQNMSAKLRALVDSGNLAYEPISGKSVIFVSLDSCRQLFAESDYLALKNGDGIEEMPISLAMRIRPIFGKSIGGNKMLPAMRFKEIYVWCGKRKKGIDAYIALINDGSLGEYDAIISNELIT